MLKKTKVYLKEKNLVPRLIVLFVFSIVAAFIYNCYIIPNDILCGGMAGLSLIINKLYPISPIFYLNILSIITLILGIIFLGFKETSYGIIGYLVYTLCINITAPLAKYFFFDFDSMLLNTIIFGIIRGAAFGFVYRTGFNTAGTDTLVEILKKYFKQPIGFFSNIINGLIIVGGLFLFGFTSIIYGITFLIICNKVCDYVLIGASVFKICFINTKEFEDTVDYISESLGSSYTIIDSTNGIGFLNRKVIMCVVPSTKFMTLKKELLKIDKNVKISTNDCYTLEGGTVDSFLLV